MKNILLFVLTFLLILTLSGCRVRLAADPDAVPDSGTVSPQDDFPGNAYRSDVQKTAAEEQDADSGSDEIAGDQGQTVENPEAARKEYDENAAVEITGGTDRLIHGEGEESGAFAESADTTLRVTKLSNSAEQTALMTVRAEEVEDTGVSDDTEAAESFLKYYTVLLQERSNSLFECKRLNVYWETAADHVTIYKTSAEHQMILNSGAYDVSSRLLEENLTVDDGWVVRKDPQLIVKIVPADVLGSAVSSTENAEAVREELLSRRDWNGIDAVRQNRVLLLSEELLTEPYLQTAAMLALAKSAAPDLYEDVDLDRALTELVTEAAGSPPTGIFIH